ncbi:uncharacterized protein LOC114260447 [Camellia sinensis]|uniref:uncharacterized protein LOC114260447 n=1 Tax=Camellia sinensis TaxID=4442 RepID=UPI0010366E8D|nr:uncharacterized protein LOC114260447 [Camellia sinensis]
MGLSANIFPSSRIENLQELSSVGQGFMGDAMVHLDVPYISYEIISPTVPSQLPPSLALLRALALLFSSFLCSTIAEAVAIAEVQRSSVGATVLHLSLLFHRSRSFRHGQRPPAPSAIHANVVDIFFTSLQSVHVSTMGLSANIFPSSRIEYLLELSSVGQH